MKKATEDSNIREYLGHNGAECRVRIKADGSVERYGSPDAADRSKDFWADTGTREDVLKEIAREETVSNAAAELGRRGGSKTSEAKRAASRENGKKGGRPRVEWPANPAGDHATATGMYDYD